MKKIVPDPPRPRTPSTPFFTFQSDMYPPGIPIEDAYEQVSILLGYIKHLVREGDMEDDRPYRWLARDRASSHKKLLNFKPIRGTSPFPHSD